ncbi:MAG: hypothetical protein ACR2OZ_08915 [Verrucomicrobiales bacterium]
MDAFAELDLPRQPAVDRDQLSRQFDALSRQCHPDAGGDTAAFTRLAQARHLLESTARRLRHLVELTTPTGKLDGPLPAACVTLFGRVGPALQIASTVHQDYQAAKSSLGRALLTERVLAARKSLESIAGEIGRRLSEMEAEFGAWDGSTETLTHWARYAAFLEKWQSQVRAALSELTLS